MNIEIAVPEDWTPGQALAVRQLLQHALHDAQPVIALIRKDATPEQLEDVYDLIAEVIRKDATPEQLEDVYDLIAEVIREAGLET